MSYFVSKSGHLDPVSTVLYTVQYRGPDVGGPDVPHSPAGLKHFSLTIIHRKLVFEM